MQTRGAGRLQLLIALAITAALFVSAARVIPVYVRSYEFEDAMRSQAKFAGVDLKTPEAIRETLYRKAQDLELPLRREQIQVSPRSYGVKIAVRYTVQVDLIVFKPNFSFDFQSDTASAY